MCGCHNKNAPTRFKLTSIMDDNLTGGILCFEAEGDPTTTTTEENSGGTIIFLVVAVGIGGE